LDFCCFVSLGAEISPIQVAASSFISDRIEAWKSQNCKNKISGREAVKEGNIAFTY
jgi:hypothetical protein